MAIGRISLPHLRNYASDRLAIEHYRYTALARVIASVHGVYSVCKRSLALRRKDYARFVLASDSGASKRSLLIW